MSYIFADDGTFDGAYSDSDSRAFVLQGLNRTLSAVEVSPAISGQSPSQIGGFPVLLILQELALRDLAATVFSESSHVRDESEGIARVMRNRAAAVGVNFGSSNLWNSHAQGGIGGDGIVGRSTVNYATANSLSIDQWGNAAMAVDLSATVRGLVNAADISGGAYFWVATAGVGTSPVFRNGLAAIPPVFLVSAALGATTFLRYNPANPAFGGHVWP